MRIVLLRAARAGRHHRSVTAWRQASECFVIRQTGSRLAPRSIISAASEWRGIGGAMRLEPSRRMFIAGIGAIAASAALPGVLAADPSAGLAYRTAGDLLKALVDR